MNAVNNVWLEWALLLWLGIGFALMWAYLVVLPAYYFWCRIRNERKYRKRRFR